MAIKIHDTYNKYISNQINYVIFRRSTMDLNIRRPSRLEQDLLIRACIIVQKTPASLATSLSYTYSHLLKFFFGRY